MRFVKIVYDKLDKITGEMEYDLRSSFDRELDFEDPNGSYSDELHKCLVDGNFICLSYLEDYEASDFIVYLKSIELADDSE